MAKQEQASVIARHNDRGQVRDGGQVRHGGRAGVQQAKRQVEFAIRFAARRAGSLARVRMQLETERFLAKNRGDFEWAGNWDGAVQAIAQLEAEMKSYALEEPTASSSSLPGLGADPVRLERMRLEDELREREEVARRHIRGVLRVRRAANASRMGSEERPQRSQCLHEPAPGLCAAFSATKAKGNSRSLTDVPDRKRRGRVRDDGAAPRMGGRQDVRWRRTASRAGGGTRAAKGAMKIKTRPRDAFDICLEVYKAARELVDERQPTMRLEGSSKYVWRPDLRPRLVEFVSDFALAGARALGEDADEAAAAAAVALGEAPPPVFAYRGRGKTPNLLKNFRPRQQPRRASRLILFRMHYLGGAEYHAARGFLGLSEVNCADWVDEIKELVGRELLRRRIFPPGRYFREITRCRSLSRRS